MYPNNDGWGAQQGGPQGPGGNWGPQPGWGPPPQQPGPQQAPQQAQPTVAPPDPDELMQGGYRAATFPDQQFGHTVGGPIIEKPRTEQQRDFDTRQPKFYDDGNPMWQIVVAVQAQPASDDDDGVRAFYLKAQMKQAVQKAVRQAGAQRLDVGGVLHVRYVRDEPNSRGRGKDKKIYEAKYAPPAGQPAPAPPAAAAPPQPTPATAPDPAVMAHLAGAQQQNLQSQYANEPPF